MKQNGFFDESGSYAVLSDCEVYRYRLGRRWAPAGDRIVFVMLNPSTADANANDPTITCCIARSKALGAASLEVVNLFAFRATDPDDMIRAATAGVDIVGPENDRFLTETCRGADRVICAWGLQPKLLARCRAVEVLLRNAGLRLHAISFTKHGTPRHPLYQKVTPNLLEWMPT